MNRDQGRVSEVGTDIMEGVTSNGATHNPQTAIIAILKITFRSSRLIILKEIDQSEHIYGNRYSRG
jgi:hypothetical protein